MKYSNTAVRELSAKYRSILKKCALLNAMVLVSVAVAAPVSASVITSRTEITSDTTYSEDLTASEVVGIENYDGGVLYVLDGKKLTIEGKTEISKTTNAYSGAGIYLKNASASFKGTALFDDNTAVASGGALHNAGDVIFENGATFNNNKAKDSGAIYNTNTIEFKKDVLFSNNTATETYGGAIKNTGDITFDGKATFTKNSAKHTGGAILNAGSMTFMDIAQFSLNTAEKDGSSIQNDANGKLLFNKGLINNQNGDSSTIALSGIRNDGLMSVIGGNIEIKDNIAKAGAGITSSSQGSTTLLGAYLDNDNKLVEAPVDNILFQNNLADGGTAGALYAGGVTKLFANNITFDGNSNKNYDNAGAYGGAIALQGGELEIRGTTNTFTNNHSDAVTTVEDNKVKFGGGVLQNRGTSTPSNVIIGLDNKSSTNDFIGNSSAMHGGAIHSRAESATDTASTIINGTTLFEGNTATLNGGAISNSPKLGTSTFTFNGDTTFKDNTAGKAGGAIYNTGSMTFNGKTTFTNNAVTSGLLYPGGAVANFGTMNFHGNTIFANNTYNFFGVYGNDIYNDGVINFDGNVTLDTATLGSGTINFYNGTALTSTLDKTTISGSEINFAGNNTINMIVENTAEAGKHNFILNSTITGIDNVEVKNDLYNMTLQDDGKINVAVKSGEELLADTPASLQEANTISALVATAGEGTAKGNAIANQISTLMQTGHKDAAVKLAEEVAPTTSQTVMGVAQGVNSILNNVVGTRMAAVGRNGGDAFVGGAMWIQGLLNHTKQDSTSNVAGFTADTNGISFGIDGKVNEDLMIGIGYGYTNTDADSGARDIDVDGHNFFAYTEYKPNKWYINGMFNYGFSKYDEQKVAGLQAKYDVNTYAANVMTGYDFNNGITPEVGLRYLLADQDSYNDGAQHVSTDKTDVLTGVVGVKYKANVKAKDWTFTPKLRLAATYDMVSDNSKANVNVIGGGNYQITGDRLERFGVETGVGIETTYADWNLSLDYNGGFRKDFQSHTGMLKAKYNF